MAKKKAVILPPDTRLKEKLGKHRSLDELIDKNDLKAASRAVDDTYSEFMLQAQDDLMHMERIIATLEAHAPMKDALQSLYNAAFSIKSLAGTYGYTLASILAKQMYNVIEDHEILDEKRLQVVHAQHTAIKSIFSHNIKGDGGKLGQDIYDNLITLVDKLK